MSMLVRRGTMCHRTSSRRLQRKAQQYQQAKIHRQERERERDQQDAQQLQRPGSARSKSPGSATGVGEGPSTSSGSRGPTPSTSKAGLGKPEWQAGGSNQGFTGKTWSEPPSRRSSQAFTNNLEALRPSVSNSTEVSVDDRRQLFSAGKLNTDASMSAYGSIVYQMKDANMESNNTCEFVYKALKVLSRTVLMTVILLIIMIVPVLMAIMGVQYLNECPLEPKIPIYLLVGGCFGTLKGLWLLCQQVRSRRYERIDDAFAEDGLDEIFTSTSYRATDVALTIFLVIWFGMGNYWVYRIYLPNFQVTLFKPNDWCSKTVYLFSVAQLIFVYVVLAVVLLTIICLACGQKCATLFDESYK
ncbi:uncharacterized protein LOC135212693 isoform X3 [Macrobrachium nipponense]|uniref:uncharacterized protein LOC135212693 isoform X3 n=1 Tax=Macrobrachium nipponense TaxID=159736 RepID=UPI0030C8B890